MAHPNSKKKRPAISLIEVMVAVALLGLAASIAIPHYMKESFAERLKECPLELKKIADAQTKYFKRHKRYTQDLRQLNWLPNENPFYLYGFRMDPAAKGSHSLNPATLCPKNNKQCYSTENMKRSENKLLNLYDLPITEFDEQKGYSIGCVGNIDTDDDLSRFIINQKSELKEISRD